MKTELIFPDQQSLWAFEATMEDLPIKIDLASATLIRRCTFDQISLARTVYNATDVRIIREIKKENKEAISEYLFYLIPKLQAKLLVGLNQIKSAKAAISKLAAKRFSDYKFHQLIK